jgi:hypothetical protein
MFTSMDLNEELFMKAWGLLGVKSKKAVVEEALRLVVRLHEQAKVRSLRGTLIWEGDRQQARKGRRASSR